MQCLTDYHLNSVFRLAFINWRKPLIHLSSVDKIRNLSLFVVVVKVPPYTCGVQEIYSTTYLCNLVELYFNSRVISLRFSLAESKETSRSSYLKAVFISSIT